MTVHATATVEVKARSVQAARNKVFFEFTGAPIPICHQCSREISDPAFGEIVDVVKVD